MSGHTPGPWNVGGEWPQVIVIYHECYPLVHVWKDDKEDSRALASCTTGEHQDWIGRNPIGRERAKANARLIAAAPDLLEACKAALALLDKQREEHEAALTVMPRPHTYERGPIATALADAIAKAEGTAHA